MGTSILSAREQGPILSFLIWWGT